MNPWRQIPQKRVSWCQQWETPTSPRCFWGQGVLQAALGHPRDPSHCSDSDGQQGGPISPMGKLRHAG